MFWSFCSANVTSAQKFSQVLTVASNLSALSCRAQKTILFSTILQVQMIGLVASTIM
jgi:hypothetical protein